MSQLISNDHIHHAVGAGKMEFQLPLQQTSLTLSDCVIFHNQGCKVAQAEGALNNDLCNDIDGYRDDYLTVLGESPSERYQAHSYRLRQYDLTYDPRTVFARHPQQILKMRSSIPRKHGCPFHHKTDDLCMSCLNSETSFAAICDIRAMKISDYPVLALRKLPALLHVDNTRNYYVCLTLNHSLLPMKYYRTYIYKAKRFYDQARQVFALLLSNSIFDLSDYPSRALQNNGRLLFRSQR
jgi:hypothetical protein